MPGGRHDVRARAEGPTVCLAQPAGLGRKKGYGRRHEGQRPIRLHYVRIISVPHVSLIDFDLVLLANESILFLKRKLAWCCS